MTTTDHTLSDDAAFLARIEALDARPDAPESYAATVERMARAMAESLGFIWGSEHGQAPEVHTYYRLLAAAAYRAEHEGGAAS